MTEHRFTDRMTIDGAIRQTDDPAIWAAQARVARAGNVQVYLGAEVGVSDRATVRVFRPEEEVFDRKAFSTYARKPITIGHPEAGVSSETWRDLAVGEIDRDVVRDGEFVSVPLLFRDAKAIELLKAADGPRELSMGYDAKIEMRDGETPSGEAYDAVMTDFRMNHVAVVPLARGGSELRIGDGAGKWGAEPITDAEKGKSMTLRKIMVDGLEVETTDAGAAAITKLTNDKAAADKALADAKAEHEKAIAAKDEEIGGLKADKKKLEDAAPKPEDLDKMVADRAELVTKARAIAKDLKVEGVADADIRKAAVAAKLGDAAVKDASEAEIKGMFRALSTDAGKGADPVVKTLRTTQPVGDAAQQEQDAYKAYLADFNPERKEAN